jgi:hypothetical protein
VTKVGLQREGRMCDVSSKRNYATSAGTAMSRTRELPAASGIWTASGAGDNVSLTLSGT